MELAGANASPQRPNSKLRSLLCQRSWWRSCTVVILSVGALWSYLHPSSSSLRRAGVTDGVIKQHIIILSPSLSVDPFSGHMLNGTSCDLMCGLLLGSAIYNLTSRGNGSVHRQLFHRGPLSLRSGPVRFVAEQQGWMEQSPSAPFDVCMLPLCLHVVVVDDDDDGNEGWCLIPHTHTHVSLSHRASRCTCCLITWHDEDKDASGCICLLRSTL